MADTVKNEFEKTAEKIGEIMNAFAKTFVEVFLKKLDELLNKTKGISKEIDIVETGTPGLDSIINFTETGRNAITNLGKEIGKPPVLPPEITVN